MKQAFLWALLIGFLLIVGTCEYWNRQSSLATSSRQIELFNSQLDTLQEEIAASRSPGGFALLALVLSVAVPIVLGVILLGRSERSALQSDEVIRQLARHGLTSKLIETEQLLDKPQSQACPRVLRLVRQSPSQGRLRSESRHADSDDEDDPCPFS